MAAKLCVEFAALSEGSFLSFKVDGDEAKATGLPFQPFKVVHEGPVVITLHRDALFDQFSDGLEMVVDKLSAKGIGGVAGAIFGDPDWEGWVVFVGPSANFFDAFGINLPAHIISGHLRQRFGPEDQRLAGEPCVIIDAHKVR